MTIPSTPRKAGPFTGNGATTSFPFAFKVFAPTDVKVVVANNAGVETVLVLNSDYTVTLNANQDTSPGGTITYPISGSPLPAGSVLSIIGNISYDQPLDLPSGGNFSPLALENQLDRTAMQIQQLAEQVDRAVKLPPTSSESTEELVADLQRVVDSADNMDAVANNITGVNTVAGAIGNVNTVAANVANVNAVATNATNINTVAGNITGVSAVGANISKVNTVAGAIGNVNTVAGAIGNVNTLATNVANVNTVAGSIGNVNTVAANITDVTNYSDTYLGPKASPPTTRNDGSALRPGDLYFNTTSGALAVYRGSGWTEITSADASTINYQPAGTGAVATTVQNKLRRVVAPEDYGAVGNGTANDSTAFTNAIAAGKSVTAAAGGNYSIRDVALSDNTAFFGGGSRLNAATGATNLFSLSGFNPAIEDVYVSGSQNCSDAAFRIKESRFAYLTDIVAVNAGNKFIRIEPTTPSSQVVAKPLLANLWAEDVSGIGLQIGSSVSEMHMTNCHIHGVLVPSGGKLRPSFTSVGWRQNTPVVSGLPVGGHLVANANMIGFGVGWHLTNAQLSTYTNCIADSCSSYGVLIDGNNSFAVKFSDLFVGTTRGIRVAGSAAVWFDGLTTIYNGVIPPWGSPDFYNNVTTFYDLEVLDTARVRVSNWRGDKRIYVAPGATLIIDGSVSFIFRSIGAVGPGVTTYLSEGTSTPTEGDALWRAPCYGHIVGFFVATTNAPGSGQSFTYTVRKNGSNTTLTGSITGTNSFTAEVWCGVNPIQVSKGDSFSMQLVTSAGAASSRHQGHILFLPE